MLRQQQSISLFSCNCPLNSRNTIHKFCSEKNISIIEHAFFQWDHNKLWKQKTKEKKITQTKLKVTESWFYLTSSIIKFDVFDTSFISIYFLKDNLSINALLFGKKNLHIFL